jgi:glycosyltransferase involved in cell wall biosynthesis
MFWHKFITAIWKKADAFFEFKNPILVLILRLTRRSFPPPYFGYTGANRSSDLRKRALLLYLSRPFYTKEKALKKVHHSNLQQVLKIADAFVTLGYIVDVVDWLDNSFKPQKNYDVFFGMHHGYERISQLLPSTCKKVYYATGAYWQFENAAEEKRLKDLKKRRGCDLKVPPRLAPNTWVEKVDAVVVMGNEFTAGTYNGKNQHIYRIDNTPLVPFEVNLNEKDFAASRTNFLAFPSTGLLHKGLDLLLESFADMKDLDLWVCGPLHASTEAEFIKEYSKELFNTSNIHPIGWTDIYTASFRNIVSRCGFIIFPSCAEGIATGVLTCMRCGLIPVVSKETGIDTGDFGVTLKTCGIDEIKTTITALSQISETEMKQRAERAISVAKTIFSLSFFGRKMEEILAHITRE